MIRLMSDDFFFVFFLIKKMKQQFDYKSKICAATAA